MATDDLYWSPAGLPIYGGWAGPLPAWATSVGMRTWTEIPGSNFRTWAVANIPSGAYLGTSPIDSIVNAFCDPAFKWPYQYFYGGGHGDGSCNAVIRCDLRDFTYSLVGAPTPPAKYHPNFVSQFGGPGTAAYPSGLLPNGFFLPLSQLTDPADQPYATPLARMSTHMYGAAAMRGSVIHYFYGVYAEFDTATGQWSGQAVDLGSQLYAISPTLNALALQQGTMAVYDEVTDRFYITLVPGDAGGGYRNHLIQFNPNTRLIEAIYNSGTESSSGYGLMRESSALLVIGRKLYIFSKTSTGFDQPQLMASGKIFDLDAKTFKRFTIQGNTDYSSYTVSGDGIETIPCWFDGTSVHRWNYQSTNKQYISSLNLTPVGGTGAPNDPYLLNQTVITPAGTPPSPLYVYKRMIYIPDAGCVALLPRANSNWYALRMS